MRNLMKILVNLLTTSRLIITIFLMILFESISQNKFIAIIAILFLTDFIDGKLARKYNVQTIYGSMMDTIGDKAMSIGLSIILIKNIPIIILPLIGEIIISRINIIGEILGKKPESSPLGKIKMWIVSITIITCYISYFKKTNIKIEYIGCFITFILQIFVIIDYVKRLKHKPKKQPQYPKEKLLYRLFSTKYYYLINNS